MNRALTLTLTLTLAPLVLLGACEFGGTNVLSNWEKDQLESRASSDLDDFVADINGFAPGLGAAQEGRDEAGAEYAWATRSTTAQPP